MKTLTVSKALEAALAHYKAALEQYEREAVKSCPSYSIVEMPKLAIADAVLESLDLPTGPHVGNRAKARPVDPRDKHIPKKM